MTQVSETKLQQWQFDRIRKAQEDWARYQLHRQQEIQFLREFAKMKQRTEVKPKFLLCREAQREDAERLLNGTAGRPFWNVVGPIPMFAERTKLHFTITTDDVIGENAPE